MAPDRGRRSQELSKDGRGAQERRAGTVKAGDVVLVFRKGAHGLTRRRLRVHAILLAICAWSVIGADFATSGLLDRAGNIKFQDFLQFYISAKLIRQRRL